MSDSVVKIRIDSKEYDANIKRAGQALTDYFNKVKEGGGTLMHLDEGVMEAVKAMGSLGTQANNIKGGLRELTQATTDMTAAYRALTDEEKASPLGQAMQKSIAQMTERAGNMRDAMADVQASINNAASDTRVFDQIAGGAQMMTAGFQSAVGAMKLFGVETDNNVEVLAQLQAAMGVVNGLQTIQTALQKQSAVMQGVQAVQAAAAAAAQTSLAGATGAATVAQKAFNLVANANPYVLLATAVAAVGTALYAFASASSKAKQEAEEMAKAEEEAAKKSEDARNAFVNASAEAMNSASRLSSLQVAYKNANSEIEKTNILKQAQAEFKKLGIECKGVNDAQTLLIKNGSKVIELIQLQGNVAAVSAVRMEKFKESFKMLMENGYSASAAASLAGYNKDVQELDGQITNMQSRIQGLKGGLGIGKSGSGSNSTKSTASTEKDEMSLNSQKITELTNEYIKATDERRQAIEKEIATLQKRNEEIQKLKDMAQGKAFTAGELGEVTVTGSKMAKVNKDFRENGASEAGLSSYIGSLKSAISQEDLGSEVFNNLTSKLQDASMFQSVLTQAIAGGASAADLSGVAQEIKQKLLEGDIDESAWQEFLDKINELIQNADLKLTFNVDTKSVTTAVKQQKKETAEMAKEWQAAGTAIQAVGSAMSQIEDPAAKVLGIIAQAVATMALSYSQAAASPAVTGSGWGWIAFAATGLATMISSINGIKQATEGFAQGGVIPGNSMSGDNLRGMTPDGTIYGLNSQEIILNRAQQGNLASQLEGGGIGNLHLDTVISGEDIRVVLKNNGRRTGRGEYITSRNSRS